MSKSMVTDADSRLIYGREKRKRINWNNKKHMICMEIRSAKRRYLSHSHHIIILLLI